MLGMHAAHHRLVESTRMDRLEVDPSIPDLDERVFHHADHVRVGFELLCRHTFPDALAAYSAALKGIAKRGGDPGAYHETITVAFLSDRRASCQLRPCGLRCVYRGQSPAVG